MVIHFIKHLRSSSLGRDRESSRQLIVKIIFVIYWLLIFEGVLRKWMFPSLNKFLFFIRDPFVLTVYYLAFRYKMWPKPTITFLFGMIIAGLFVLIGISQSFAYGVNPLISAIGWRGYFWYVPLVFLIGEHFRGKDLSKLCRETLLVTIPIAVLVYLQFKSPPGAYVNKTFDEDALAMTVSGEIVRTSGTFTFPAGQVMFIDSILAMILTMWLLPKAQRPLGPVMLLVTTAAVLVNLYVAGSRSAFFGAAFALLGALLSGFCMTNIRQRFRAFLLPGVLSFIGVFLYITVFATAYQAMSERQAIASENEGSTIGRALRIFTSVFETMPHMTAIGVGIGLGSNAGAVLGTGTRQFALAEHELPRIIDEAGLAGIVYIVFRYWLLIQFFGGAWLATRRTNNPLPLLLLSFEGVLLAVGQMTLQGTINGYGWLFAGFCMAANRLGLKQDQPNNMQGLSPSLNKSKKKRPPIKTARRRPQPRLGAG